MPFRCVPLVWAHTSLYRDLILALSKKTERIEPHTHTEECRLCNNIRFAKPLEKKVRQAAESKRNQPGQHILM